MTNTIAKHLDLDVHHITRVEGHGNIVVSVSSGVLEQCDLEIIEAPRFFEAMLRNQPYQQASRLASRICGICAVAHATTSLRAIENALGVEPSRQTRLLRELNYYGEMLDSHILHVYMLVAPDYFGLGSVIPLAESAPDVVLRALRMKRVAGEICRVVCGRHTHPIAMTVGGFTHLPKVEELVSIQEAIRNLRKDVQATVELFQGLEYPEFERETEYIALSMDGKYCFIDGEINSSQGGLRVVADYRQVTNEYLVAHSTAKHARNLGPSYMVGALARFNLNYETLHSAARQAAQALNIHPTCRNPYKIAAAQVVEIVHCVESAIELIDTILGEGIADELPRQPLRLSGEAVGACEAPRGTLFHHYVIQHGLITEANCIIPTAQNLANIELDMRALVPTILDRSPDEVTRLLEMLVRAYDPCISCSAHFLNVNYV